MAGRDVRQYYPHNAQYDGPTPSNSFRNDGSFLEMYRRQQGQPSDATRNQNLQGNRGHHWQENRGSERQHYPPDLGSTRHSSSSGRNRQSRWSPYPTGDSQPQSNTTQRPQEVLYYAGGDVQSEEQSTKTDSRDSVKNSLDSSTTGGSTIGGSTTYYSSMPTTASSSSSLTAKKNTNLPIIGRRRNLKPLKTGMVKKSKPQEKEDTGGKKDAWSQYMAEVQKYKDQSCKDEDQTRPLVK